MKLLQHLCSASPEPRMNAHNCSQLERGKKGLATHNTISVEDTWVAHCTWVISKCRKIKRKKARWLDFLRLLLLLVTSQQLLQLQHDTQLFQVLICELTRHIQIKTFESTVIFKKLQNDCVKVQEMGCLNNYHSIWDKAMLLQI